MFSPRESKSGMIVSTFPRSAIATGYLLVAVACCSLLGQSRAALSVAKWCEAAPNQPAAGERYLGRQPARLQPAGLIGQSSGGGEIRLCQWLSPAAPHCIQGIDCAQGGPCHELGWEAMRTINWQAFAQGEYVGHFRLEHVPEYRLRPEDDLEFVYLFTLI